MKIDPTMVAITMGLLCAYGCDDRCMTDNGGCGDATYWTCVSFVGAEPICMDINECATDNGGCGDPTCWACVNNSGAEPACVQIDECAPAETDECAIDNGGCGDPTYWSCINNPGAEPSCVDVDECTKDNGGCGDPSYWTCINNPGAEPSCVDINECATDNGGCGDPTYWTCVNKLGAEPGCVDIDECANDNGGCGDPSYWTCVDNPGAEPTCVDNDGCAIDNGGCGDPSYWTCVNKLGAEPACGQIHSCRSGWKRKAYDKGFAIGVKIVSAAWAGIDENCDRLEEFETFIVDTLIRFELPPRISEFKACKYSGVVEGVLQAIDEFYLQCGEQCAEEGKLIGEISAIAYCQLSFALDGLASAEEFVRAPVQFCGEVFQIACDLNFNTVTRAYVDDTWDDPLTPDLHEGMCVQYTDEGDILDPATNEPMWEPVWSQVRNIQCAYLQPDGDVP